MIKVVKQSKSNYSRMLNRRTLRYYWRAAWGQKQYLIPDVLSTTPFHIMQHIVQPFLISEIIASLTKSPIASSRVYGLLWWWLATVGLSFVVLRIVFYFHNRLQVWVQRDLDELCLEQFAKLDPAFFANQFTGSLVTRVSKFNAGFEKLSDAITTQFSTLLVQIAGAVVIIGGRSWQLAALVIFASILVAFVTQLVSRYRIPLIRRGSIADSKVTGFFADFISNILSVKSFAQLSGERRTFQARAQERIDRRMESRNMGERIRVIRTFIMDGLQFAVLLLLIHLAIKGVIDVATIVLMQIYLFRLVDSLWGINQVATQVQEALGNAGEMTEVLDTVSQLQDPISPEKVRISEGNISFQKVQFQYDDQNSTENLFEGLDLTIPAGQKVGLVGPSGGGKSTLTKLLLRFVDIQDGEIVIDGQNIARVAQDDLRNCIAYVPQEPMLFHRSIKENIAYGDASAKDEAIVKAARLAHADDFIKKLPNSYDTLVGERGVKLSGGEKQRIAIARAMLKKAPILILDEATSALDSKSEKAIVAALDNLMKGRTTIVVAHRLSTIRKLDRIIVLKDGRVMEDGTHEQLLVKKGLYSELWNHQSGEFLTED